MNKLVYLGLSKLDLRKTVMYKFWYDYVKPKSAVKTKLCYMDTESFIVYIKTNDIYERFQKMLKQDLTLQTMDLTDHCLKENIKKQLDW